MTAWSRFRRRALRVAAGAVLLIVAITLALVLPLRWLNPPTTAMIMLDALSREQPIQQWWLPMEAISPWLAASIIAAEDQKFPHHRGFDLEQLAAVLGGDGSPTRGASTLTQQLAKNLYLWRGRSYLRKALEAWLTLWMEWCWPKQRILEIYLNVVEFGPGVYGAGAAGERLLGTSARLLTPHQAAVLAAVLPNPRRMSAASPSPYVERRAAQIEEAVTQLGGLAYLRSLQPLPAATAQHGGRP